MHPGLVPTIIFAGHSFLSWLQSSITTGFPDTSKGVLVAANLNKIETISEFFTASFTASYVTFVLSVGPVLDYRAA